MAHTKLDKVTKVFTEDDGGEIVAVDEVSIDIDDGEFLVLVGPSGCGKSTTLRMVAGLESITSGTISLDDRTINDVPAKDRDIAMVFQSYALYPHMTVRENMSFGLEESTDMPDEEIRERVEETASMMGIENLLDRKPGELSGGQQQRVALGRSIVRDPSVFLMDEPLSNLDAKLRAEMRTELQQLQSELGTTTIYVTHDQTEAMTMGDRIAILNDGVLQQIATPLECYHQPNNLFVAGFMGEPAMNFIDVRRDGERLVTGDGALEYSLDEATLADLGEVTDLVLGVRPEDIEVVARSGSPADHEFEASVTVVEPKGNENNVYLDMNGIDLIAAVPGLRSIETGSTVRIRIPEAAIHLFDRTNGTALHNRRLDEELTADSPV
ncbi:ABC transporter ATP-binding protein [Halalkalicoccus jeotgali]|uniref:ABC-type D-xylose/L-arabinose transporter n=1 Tax=Halalkalicoccus jeotgali (strain DSM 18796 / CECT 7217 / JCM 14584 / KCTC 4019 / B3) TaxID=795797 RepID=D8J2D6_HALJB|nr:sn-glycerol-3-phosphate ABC transporter ATP-binding protein UgpC [Halalkalicoccus jeotgali]ADJ14893.1 ABC-type transport system ATP-binding protein (probable substrate sugar) [Halalkalicoccus jeotgali B3]ELY39475.1 ABC transporter ATP-binding protein [Halalkalicoccus jeotgali B3]